METRFRLEDEGQRDELLADIDEGSWAILTAFATTGEQWTDEENEQADRSLYADLQTRGITQIYRITGYNPSSGHAEPGWAFPMDLTMAMQLGEMFKQDALYLVVDASLFLHGCTAGEARLPVSLGFFRDRLDVSEEPGGRG